MTVAIGVDTGIDVSTRCWRLIDQLGERLSSLQRQWKDEGHYERIEEYEDVICTWLKEVDPTIILDRMIKRPFGFHLTLGQKRVTFTICATYISFKERR